MLILTLKEANTEYTLLPPKPWYYLITVTSFILIGWNDRHIPNETMNDQSENKNRKSFKLSLLSLFSPLLIWI